MFWNFDIAGQNETELKGKCLISSEKKCIQQVVETVSSKFNDIQREKQTITVTHVWIMKRTNLRKAT